MTYRTIMTSPDGITWTVRPNPWDSVSGLAIAVTSLDKTSDPTQLGAVAVSFIETPGHIIESSGDGVSWTGRTSDLDTSVAKQGTCVAYDGDLDLVLVGNPFVGGPTPVASVLLASTDLGVTWSNVFTAADPPDLVAGGGIFAIQPLGPGFLIGGRHLGVLGGPIITSLLLTTDGSTFSPISSDFDGGGTVQSIAADGATVIAVGTDHLGHGLVTISTDTGATWSTLSTPFSGAGFDPTIIAAGGVVGHGGSKWLMWDLAAGELIYNPTPTDPMTWDTQTTPFDGSALGGLAYNPDLERWVGVGQGNDGGVVMAGFPDISWSEVTTPLDDPGFGSFLNGVCWSEALGLFIAVGSGDVAATASVRVGSIGWS